MNFKVEPIICYKKECIMGLANARIILNNPKESKMKSSVLLVDDDEVIRETVSAQLKGFGYDVTVVGSGKEAVKLMMEMNGNIAFDLIITNLMLDNINGIDILKMAKKNNPKTIVIILTGYTDLDFVLDSLRLQVDDYIIKPCGSKELNHRIKRCIERFELKKKIRLYEDTLQTCPSCNKIRVDSGENPDVAEWVCWEEYISKKWGIKVSLSYCPACVRDNAAKDIAFD